MNFSRVLNSSFRVRKMIENQGGDLKTCNLGQRQPENVLLWAVEERDLL